VQCLASHTAAPTADRPFVRSLLLAILVGAFIRFGYVLADDRFLVGGDGFTYHLEALRLADGLGYTSAFGDVGAETANHPPGWVSLLGLAAKLGARSFRAHQLVGVVIGLGLVALVGWIGRRYFSARVGVVAAFVAALYPGFWIFEAQVLSEPLGLLVLGCAILVLWTLRERPTLLSSIAVGGTCGLAALVRSEQILLLGIVVVPTLLSARTLRLRERIGMAFAAGLAAALVISPWTVYNGTRFAAPVILSTNSGPALLLGNCPPSTYAGDRLGYWDEACQRRLLWPRRELDRSQKDPLARAKAFSNLVENRDKLPAAIPARWGRAVGLFRPGQTVDFTAQWLTSERWPVWAWVVSFWLLAPLAVLGVVRGRRERVFLAPLLAPLLTVFVVVSLMSGDLRYRVCADLGIVVLAAAALDRWCIPPRRADRASRAQRDTTAAHTIAQISGSIRKRKRLFSPISKRLPTTLT
jgi:4-amino-4-deoxy-L-arabinose transferase-like glycosyltransferase